MAELGGAHGVMAMRLSEGAIAVRACAAERGLVRAWSCGRGVRTGPDLGPETCGPGTAFGSVLRESRPEVGPGPGRQGKPWLGPTVTAAAVPLALPRQFLPCCWS